MISIEKIIKKFAKKYHSKKYKMWRQGCDSNYFLICLHLSFAMFITEN